MIGDTVDAYYAPFDRLPDYLPEPKYPRTPGYRPDGGREPAARLVRQDAHQGRQARQAQGPAGRAQGQYRVAGVPMMNGSSTLEGYVPDVDATVATRMLDAGGEIVGKAHCEYFCLFGRQPHQRDRPGRTIRRSAAIRPAARPRAARPWSAAGEVDMAIGGDQGGSIRMPAAFCGIYGMKATYGLVPYTGVLPIEMTHRPYRADDRDRRPTMRCCWRCWPAPTGSTRASTAPQPRAIPRRSARASAGLRIGIVTRGLRPSAQPGRRRC